MLPYHCSYCVYDDCMLIDKQRCSCTMVCKLHSVFRCSLCYETLVAGRDRLRFEKMQSTARYVALRNSLYKRYV